MKHDILTSDTLHGLCSALAHQLHAGIAPGDALALLAQDAGGALAQTLSAMAEAADGGEPLAQVFSGAGCFPRSLCGLLAAGEAVGRTEETLFALARYHEQKAAADRRLRSAVVYPCALAVVLLAVSVVLLCWVLPVFDQVYGILGSRLTGLAAGLLVFGQGLRRVLPFLGAVVLAALIAAAVPCLRRAFAGLLRKLFGRGRLPELQARAGLARGLALGLAGGLTEAEVFRLAVGAAEGTPAFRARCTAVQEALDNGDALSAALRAETLLPQAECRLLEAALRSGGGERAMEEIARRLQVQYDEALEARISAVEPALVLISSLLVGCVLLAVMLPLAQLLTALG